MKVTPIITLYNSIIREYHDENKIGAGHMKLFKRTVAFIIALTVTVSVLAACNSESTVSRLNDNGGLRVGYCSCSEADDAPFVLEAKEGKASDGITGEPASNIADSLGTNAVFTRVNTAESYDKLMDGSVDCLWNCPPPSKALVSSVRTIETGLYYRQVIMTTSASKINRLADVKGKSLAVVSGSDAQVELHNASVMEKSLKKIIICSNMQQVLQKLASGEVQCAAVDEPQAIYAAAHFKEKGTDFKYIKTPIAESGLVIVTRADDADLCSLLAEKYVSLSQKNVIKELCQKYGLDVMLSSAMKDNPAEVNT